MISPRSMMLQCSFAAQIEEAVTQPHILRIVLVAEYRNRQFGGGPQHSISRDIDFDQAGRHVGVLGAGRALAHASVDAHDPFGAQILGEFESWRIGIATHWVIP